jgi:hypothetical protein
MMSRSPRVRHHLRWRRDYRTSSIPSWVLQRLFFLTSPIFGRRKGGKSHITLVSCVLFLLPSPPNHSTTSSNDTESTLNPWPCLPLETWGSACWTSSPLRHRSQREMSSRHTNRRSSPPMSRRSKRASIRVYSKLNVQSPGCEAPCPWSHGSLWAETQPPPLSLYSFLPLLTLFPPPPHSLIPHSSFHYQFTPLTSHWYSLSIIQSLLSSFSLLHLKDIFYLFSSPSPPSFPYPCFSTVE